VKRNKSKPIPFKNAGVPGAKPDTPPDKLYGEPITVTVAGEEYSINRIRLEDMSKVYGRIRNNRLNALLRIQNSCRDHVIAEALAWSASIDPTPDDFWAYMQTPVGAVYIFWLCMVGNHPGIKETDVAELLDKQGGLLEMLFAESGLYKASGAPAPDTEGENRDPLADKPAFAANQKDAGKTPQDGL